MFEIEDGGDIPEEQFEEKPKEVVAPPPVPQSPVDVTKLAGDIVSEVMRGLTVQAQQDMSTRVSATQAWVEKMLRTGKGTPESIGALLELREAEKADEARHNQHAQTEGSVQAFNMAVWSDVDSAFDEFSEAIPRLDDSEKRIKLDTHKKLMANPEVKERIEQNKKPTPKQIKLAMASVIDEKLKQEGRSRPAMPIDRASSKPAVVTASNTDSAANLNSGQKSFYNAFRKELGDAEALKIAKTI